MPNTFTITFTGIPDNPRSSKPHMPARTYDCTVTKQHDGQYNATDGDYGYVEPDEFLAKQGLMRFIRESNDPHSNNESRWSVS